MSPDVTVHGQPGATVYLVTPVTPTAKTWLQENLQGEVTWFGASVAVEHRYVELLILGMMHDGLRVVVGGDQ